MVVNGLNVHIKWLKWWILWCVYFATILKIEPPKKSFDQHKHLIHPEAPAQHQHLKENIGPCPEEHRLGSIFSWRQRHRGQHRAEFRIMGHVEVGWACSEPRSHDSRATIPDSIEKNGGRGNIRALPPKPGPPLPGSQTYQPQSLALSPLFLIPYPQFSMAPNPSVLLLGINHCIIHLNPTPHPDYCSLTAFTSNMTPF